MILAIAVEASYNAACYSWMN